MRQRIGTTSSEWIGLLAILLIGIFPVASEAVGTPRALVVGNASYTRGPLKNTLNDARGIAADLRSLGFSVVLETDLGRRAFNAALRAFSATLEPDDVALFFYAGHGVQFQGENFLIPLDADIQSEADLPYEGVNVARVLEHLEETGSRLNIVILDACRNNPFGDSFRSLGAASRGLARMDGPPGTLLAYATGPGDVAADGTGIHSPYTRQLRHFIKQPGLSVMDMFNEVGLAVLKTTNNQQNPWISAAALPRFCFAGCAPVAQYEADPGSSPGESSLAQPARQQQLATPVTADNALPADCDKDVAPTLTEIEDWLQQFLSAFQAKDVAKLVALGAVAAGEDAAQLRSRLQGYQDYEVLLSTPSAERYADRVVLRFVRVDRWRDGITSSVVSEHAQESITLHRDGCDRLAVLR